MDIGVSEKIRREVEKNNIIGSINLVLSELSLLDGKLNNKNCLVYFDLLKEPVTNKIKVPNILNFIWIGTIDKVHIEYISVWEEVNNDKDIYL